MEKRLIVTIILSALVIIIFQILFPQPKMTQPVTQPPTQQIASLPVMERTLSEESFREQMFEEQEAVVETGKYSLTFTNIGGSLRDVKLKEHIAPETGSPLHLVADAKENRAIFSMESNALTKSLDKRDFILVKKEKDEIAYTYSVPAKFRVVKRYIFRNYIDYIELQITITNLGNDVIYRDYDILGASSIQSANMAMGRSFLETASMVNGKIIRNARIKNGELLIKGIVSWTGVKERYFCIVLKPQQDSEAVILKQFSKTNLASGVRTTKISVYPGETIEDSYILYIGPNNITQLQSLGFGLEQIISYGIFGGITKFLLTVLRIFYTVTRNWGVAIISLTFLINIILFPLTRKSFLSMRSIQEVQPHMEKLRKIHKDNPQRLNKELAELYRQYNINPFGGCLPLLLQMPIFIALYQGLIRSIELKGANFLWIRDLSIPDYLHIPFSLPVLGNQIHVLPILMVIAMFFQQRISTKHTPVTTKEQKQQQNVMLIFFPLFFGFIFYNFPSGLVLYWLTNTVLMVAEQSIMRRSLSK